MRTTISSPSLFRPFPALCVAGLAVLLAVLPAAAQVDLTGKSPTQVYQEFRKAMEADDADTVMACVSATKGFNGNSLAKAAIPLLKSVLPVEVEVLGEEITDTTAILMILDKKADKNGTASLTQEDGVWKVVEENWKGEDAALGPASGPGAPAAPMMSKEEFADILSNEIGLNLDDLRKSASGDPEVSRLAREFMGVALTFLHQTAEAQNAAEQAAALHAEAMAERTSVGCTQKVIAMRAQLKRLQDAKAAAEMARDEANSLIAKIEKIREDTHQQREDERKAKEAAEAAQKAEEERKRKEELHKQLVEQELATAEGAHQRVLPSVQANQFKEALDALRTELDTLQTDEGKAAMGIVIDRCERLAALQSFMITRLNTVPFKWGWIQHGSPLDILGADPAGINVRGKGKVAWNEVTPTQTLKIVRHYLSDTRAVKLRERAEQNLNAAIFCYEHGAKDAAKGFVDGAAQAREDMTDRAKKLMPDLSLEMF